ncbi:hypothetical protein [Paraburkholderia youngii]|uniref:hypothetical protein n=1 Tax=Paraburkholderia youngii TaxID=2782701 RepID=UPI003D1A8790
MDELKAHPAANLFPMMGGDEWKAFVEDVRKHGVRDPIITLDGMILDGRNRYKAARMAGRECRSIALGEFSETDPVQYVLSANLHRRQLTQEQRREVIAKVLREQPMRSDREIAKRFGVHHTTVGTVRSKLEDKGVVAKVATTIGANGKEQSRKRKPDPVPRNVAPAPTPKPEPEPEPEPEPADVAPEATEAEVAEVIDKAFGAALEKLPEQVAKPFNAALKRAYKALELHTALCIAHHVKNCVAKQTHAMRRELSGLRFMEREWRRVIEADRQAEQPVEQFWTLDEYRKIRSALHPDRDPSKEKLDEAYKLFSKADAAFEKVKRRQDGIAKAAATRAEKKAPDKPGAA